MEPDAKILAEALKLPVKARAALAAKLLRSLDDQDQDVSKAEYVAAWDAEIERRVKELDEGSVTTAPWEEARQRIVSDEE